MINQIITPTEFATYRDIGKKLDSDKINECIKLAQSVDLYDVLNDFYFDLIENLEAANYQDLLDGSTFQVEGESYYQSGIKSLLSDYTYSRYIYQVNTNLTPFGAVTKLSNDSQSIDRNLVKDISKQTLIDANVKFKMIDNYLKANSTIFSRYSTGNNEGINTFSNNYWIL